MASSSPSGKLKLSRTSCTFHETPSGKHGGVVAERTDRRDAVLKGLLTVSRTERSRSTVAKTCESKIGGGCVRAATWKQTVHAGDRESGRILFHSHWCDEHVEIISERRRRDWSPPPRLERLVVEVS
jgi:hypothetical protein